VELSERTFAATQGVDVAPAIRGVLEGGLSATPPQLPAGLAELVEMLDPEVEIDPRGAGVPGFGVLHGLQGMLEFWTRWMEEWEHFSWSHTNLESAGDHVVGDVTLRATGKASGADVVWHACQAWRFRDGKVIRWVMYADRASALVDIERP
jgi:ketosteroid isomerase-like protein